MPVKLLAKDMEEQLELTHKVIEVVDRSHRKTCVTMLGYNMENQRLPIFKCDCLEEGRIKFQSNCLCEL